MREGAQSVGVIFIAGMSRSGTTLVSEAIEAHSQHVASMGEVAFYWTQRSNIVCSCGAMLDQCRVWGSAPTPTPAHRGRRYKWQPPTAELARLYVHFSTRMSVPVVIDESKTPRSLLRALRSGVPMTVVRVSRPLRGVLKSLAQEKIDTNRIGRPAMSRQHPVVTTLAWVWRNSATHLIARVAQAVGRGTYLVLQFDEFQARPSVLSSKLDALHPELAMAVVGRSFTAAQERHVGWANPSRAVPGQLVRIRSA